MKENSLSKTNRYLTNPVKAQQLMARSIASSTAIETLEILNNALYTQYHHYQLIFRQRGTEYGTHC